MQPLRRTDEDRTQIIEGAAKGVPLWSHMTRVEPCGEYGAVCVDQVEISARSAYSGCDARCGNLSESGTEEQKPPNEKRVTDYKKIGNRCTVSDFFAKFVHLPIECSALVDYNHQCMINNKHT